MSHDMKLIEATRARFRPERIMTLFVGESAPARGGFFYFGNNAMVRYVQRAIECSPLGRDGADILDRFKALGWFLDDLSLAPVDNLPEMERVAICRDAQRSLAERIAEYQPQAIVSVVKRVNDDIVAAAIAAGSNAPRFSLPFPGNGHQNKFVNGLAAIIPQLPRLCGRNVKPVALRSTALGALHQPTAPSIRR